MKKLIITLMILPGLVNAEPYSVKPSIPPLKLIKHDSTLFEKVIKCYPAPSLFDMEIKFQTGLRQQNGSEYYDQSGFKTNAYAGLVMEVPLYSTKERFRALHEESKRRETLAKDIATLDKAISKKIKSKDMYQLYKALEIRSIQRVKDGYVPLDEQIKYIEKGAAAYAQFMEAQAEISAATGDIAAFCTTEKRPQIEALLNTHIEKGLTLYEMD